MKAHAYITYNVKIKSSQRKILLCNNAEFIEKSTKSGKNHGKQITNILTENACNINNPLFNTKKKNINSKLSKHNKFIPRLTPPYVLLKYICYVNFKSFG